MLIIIIMPVALWTNSRTVYPNISSLGILVGSILLCRYKATYGYLFMVKPEGVSTIFLTKPECETIRTCACMGKEPRAGFPQLIIAYCLAGSNHFTNSIYNSRYTSVYTHCIHIIMIQPMYYIVFINAECEPSQFGSSRKQSNRDNGSSSVFWKWMSTVNWNMFRMCMSIIIVDCTSSPSFFGSSSPQMKLGGPSQ